MIDYNQEVARLDSFVPGENSQFWKPKSGQYRTKALTELEDAEPFRDKSHPEKEAKPQAKIDLLIDDKRYTWTMAKGISPASAYGQLCHLGKIKGHLSGIEFMIVVTSDGKKNTYTIVSL